MRHGVTVAGTSVRDCIFRSVFSARNAEYQVRAMTIGSNIASLSAGETKLAGQISAKTTGLARSWEYWSMAKAGGLRGRQFERISLVVIPAAQVDAVALLSALGHAHDVDEEPAALLKLGREELDVAKMGDVMDRFSCHGSGLFAFA